MKHFTSVLCLFLASAASAQKRCVPDTLVSIESIGTPSRLYLDSAITHSNCSVTYSRKRLLTEDNKMTFDRQPYYDKNNKVKRIADSVIKENDRLHRSLEAMTKKFWCNNCPQALPNDIDGTLVYIIGNTVYVVRAGEQYADFKRNFPGYIINQQTKIKYGDK